MQGEQEEDYMETIFYKKKHFILAWMTTNTDRKCIQREVE